jgi:hypothetical protein
MIVTLALGPGESVPRRVTLQFAGRVRDVEGNERPVAEPVADTWPTRGWITRIGTPFSCSVVNAVCRP